MTTSYGITIDTLTETLEYYTFWWNTVVVATSLPSSSKPRNKIA
jgi:hypothetical protein